MKFETAKLDSLVDSIFSGGTPTTTEKSFWNGDLPWLSSGETRNRFITETEKTITEKGATNSSTRKAFKNDIVIASAGQGHTRGQTSFLLIDSYINQSVVAIRAKKDVINPLWLFYNISNRYEELRQLSDSHSSRGSLTTSLLKTLEVKYPDYETQKYIADCLYSLDSKIELNNQINQTLEAMAQAIFKSWFVDFEPVKTKMAVLQVGGSQDEAELAAMMAISGKTAEQLGTMRTTQAEAYQQLIQTATLFPAAMQESEFGEIPKGWSVIRVEDIAEKIGMGPFGSNIKVSTFVEDGVPVISGQHLKEALVTDSENNYITETHAEKLKNSLVYPEDVIFTHAGNIGQVSLIPLNSKYKKYIISQRQFYLRVNRKKSSPYLLTYFFRSSEGQHKLLANASQVGVPSIARPSTHLKSIELVHPSLDLANSFELIVSSLLKGIVGNRQSTASLISLRDSLLPKLLSGEIDVSAINEVFV